MSSKTNKDITSEDELDEPWLLNYNPPDWFEQPLSGFDFNFPFPRTTISPPFFENRGFQFMDMNHPPKNIVQGVTGLYNYKVPTDLQFAQCNKVNGLSLWDQNGWWQCLFPQELIRERLQKLYKKHNSYFISGKNKLDGDHNELTESDMEKFISRESVENSGSLSDYFNDYTKYLLWKESNQKTIEDREIKEEKRDKDVLNADDMMKWDLSTKDPTINMNTTSHDKKVIGQSQYMSYVNDFRNEDDSGISNESSKEVKTTKIYYDDGSCLVREREKIIPKDGSKPIIKEKEKVVKDKPSSSWF